MRRTLILSAVGTITLLAGLGVGATLATAGPVQPSPATSGCPMTEMSGMTGMTEMMQMMQMMGGGMSAAEADHAPHHQGTLP